MALYLTTDFFSAEITTPTSPTCLPLSLGSDRHRIRIDGSSAVRSVWFYFFFLPRSFRAKIDLFQPQSRVEDLNWYNTFCKSVNSYKNLSILSFFFFLISPIYRCNFICIKESDIWCLRSEQFGVLRELLSPKEIENAKTSTSPSFNLLRSLLFREKGIVNITEYIGTSQSRAWTYNYRETHSFTQTKKIRIADDIVIKRAENTLILWNYDNLVEKNST